ncbi:HAMP domain-containing histidine kinase [Sphingomonas sp. CL5.1]|nr:HAMP domain-containing histidine kinase [Sphingomonas sp. CL5.1]
MRQLFRSLHARMLALSVVATLIALLVAGWAIAGVLERFVIEGLDRRLDSEVSLLASAVDADGSIDRTRLQQNLGALEGAGGWRWRIVAPGQTLQSSDFPRLDPGPPRPPAPLDSAGAGGPRPPAVDDERLQPLEGISEDGVRVHARELTIETRRGPVTLTAAAPRAVVSRPIREALMPLLLTLLVLGVVLGAAALLQLRVGLRPVRQLRDQVAAIRSGGRSRVDEGQPTELRPLAIELNQLAEENRAALAAARQSAANLAHSLKTPVSALAIQLIDFPELAAQVSRIDTTIRHHLARARSQAVNRRISTPLAPAIDDLVTAIRGIHADRELEIVTDIPGNPAVAVDPQDLDELIGNLLDNAARHATSRVSLFARPGIDGTRRVAIGIADDGPGIAEHERLRATQPGTRLDERGDGHGFGLSIVSEIAALYGATVEMREAEGGGLLVVLTLPRSEVEGDV